VYNDADVLQEIMHAELASQTLVTAAIVVTCLSVVGDTYILPDDVVSPTLTHYRRHQRQQQHQQQGSVTHDEVVELVVTVQPEYTLMHRRKLVNINCTAEAMKERPYISFFVSILT